jgi:hypothetical protein
LVHELNTLWMHDGVEWGTLSALVSRAGLQVVSTRRCCQYCPISHLRETPVQNEFLWFLWNVGKLARKIVFPCEYGYESNRSTESLVDSISGSVSCCDLFVLCDFYNIYSHLEGVDTFNAQTCEPIEQSGQSAADATTVGQFEAAECSRLCHACTTSSNGEGGTRRHVRR